MEFLIVLAFFGYIYYLRNYADLRTATEKEFDNLAEGIKLYENGQIDNAFSYFDQRIREKPKSVGAYLYRGLCYKSLGKLNEAGADFRTGLSYDDAVYQLHLELAKLYLAENQLNDALASVNKAVSLAEGTSADVFLCRAEIYSALNEDSKAADDLATAKRIRENEEQQPALPKKKTPFIDRRLIASAVMVVFTSALSVYVIKEAEGVHVPYLVAVGSAISIGFVEPHKGWFLAILQSILLFLGYTFFTAPPESGARAELENFGLYGSILLTFAASFLGGFLKRALNMN